MPPAAAECGWSACGQPARIDGLVSVPGEPPWLALPVGGYCVGHAVVIGVQAQAHHGGALWYAVPLGRARDGRTGRN